MKYLSIVFILTLFSIFSIDNGSCQGIPPPWVLNQQRQMRLYGMGGGMMGPGMGGGMMGPGMGMRGPGMMGPGMVGPPGMAYGR
uniref:Uncharacterized protein n=1 Tax=Strongyloides venezuelensis TaxID=75913 RepID=A0A0K0FF94_STRVS